MKSDKTTVVILEYCGGSNTDSLYDSLRRSNPEYEVCVLDNASPSDRCNCITHSNSTNSYIGGGIIDCINLARARQSEYLCFITNDIELVAPVRIATLEEVIKTTHEIVQVGVSFTHDSAQASVFRWMVNGGTQACRVVPHCDLCFCILRLSHIESFGGFPRSKGGYGYDWQIAYEALKADKKILIHDAYTVRHRGDVAHSDYALGKGYDKTVEMAEVYRDIYGDINDHRRIYSEILSKFPEYNVSSRSERPYIR